MVELIKFPVKADPAAANALVAEGIKLEEDQKRNAALKIYKRALQLDPTDSSICVRIGNIYFALGALSKSEEWYRKATTINPNDKLAWLNLGNILHGNPEKRDEALFACEKAVELWPTSATAHYHLADTLRLNGQDFRAIRHWQACVRLEPSGPWADKADEFAGRAITAEKMAIARRRLSAQLKLSSSQPQPAPTRRSVHFRGGPRDRAPSEI